MSKHLEDLGALRPSPHFNPKHAYKQVNGETEISQQTFILKRNKGNKA